MNRFAAAATVILALASPAAAMDQTTFETLAARVYGPIMDRHAIPGLAVGITLEGETFTYVAGTADPAEGTPVTRETLFELGSVSKLFTVALAALAEQRGHLSLDDRVEDHVDSLAGTRFGALTLADLATHLTGGLPLQVPDDVRSRDALTAWLARWEPPAASPSTTRSYSNISIGMLGTLTARTMGGGYREALEGTLFPQLGLRNTFISVPDDRMKDYATGTTKSGRPARVSPGLLDAEAYGVKSTVTDMALFLSEHLGTTSTDAATASLLKRTRTVFADTAFYAQAMVWEGYAWPVAASTLRDGNSPDMGMRPQPVVRREQPQEPAGAMFWNKTGSTGGFGAYVAMVPSERIGVAVLANRGYPNPVRAEAALDLIEAVLAAEGRPVPAAE